MARPMSLLGPLLDGPRVRLEAISPTEYRILRTVDGEQFGRLALDEAGGALIVQALCVDEAHRGYGAGSGAAALIREAWARDKRWTTLRAFAPAGAGLAVYYWMRMGLRPVPGEGPEGGLLFERTKGP
jgi:GNAT superfamily N-acetyltransferase